MKNSVESVSKKWMHILLLEVISCSMLLSLTFDLVIEYQIVFFFISVFLVPFSLVKFISAIRVSIATRNFPSKELIISILCVFLITGLLYSYRHGAFYGRKVLDATFLDERGRMDLALYVNGHYIINSGWIFGAESFSGTYKINGASIIFDKYPVVDNDFIAKTITKHGNKIYFLKNEQGQLRDTSFYFFKINNISN